MKRLLVIPIALTAMLAGAATGAVQDLCGPFTDVSLALCPYVYGMYVLGITAGTSPTTYSPDATMTRGQAAVFVSKGVNQAIARSSRRAALGQWWTTRSPSAVARTPFASEPLALASDGTDVWVGHLNGEVSRVRGSDGRILETWTGAGVASKVLVASGRIFVLSGSGVLSLIDPSQPPGAVTPVASDLGAGPILDMAFDGERIWVAGGDRVSVVNPGPAKPWDVETVPMPDLEPLGAVYDGAHIWISGHLTDPNAGVIRKLDSDGAILQSVTVGRAPRWLLFDGANIWALNNADETISVVQVASGSVLATLGGNGMKGSPGGVAFDGLRVLVSTFAGLSEWNASTLEPSNFVPLDWPLGLCSDGVSFWAALYGSKELGRY